MSTRWIGRVSAEICLSGYIIGHWKVIARRTQLYRRWIDRVSNLFLNAHIIYHGLPQSHEGKS